MSAQTVTSATQQHKVLQQHHQHQQQQRQRAQLASLSLLQGAAIARLSASSHFAMQHAVLHSQMRALAANPLLLAPGSVAQLSVLQIQLQQLGALHAPAAAAQAANNTHAMASDVLNSGPHDQGTF
jgi:hypothetical protein